MPMGDNEITYDACLMSLSLAQSVVRAVQIHYGKISYSR